MSMVTIAILSRDEAAALKADAQHVLLSLKRRAFCGCERPVRDGGRCIKCGRAEQQRVSASLYRVVESLEQIARSRPAAGCPVCGDVMEVVMAPDEEYWWCGTCDRSREPSTKAQQAA